MAGNQHGPMHGNARGPKPKVKNPGKLLMRLLAYIFKNYGFACIIVVICLFINVFSSVQGTLFMQTLIDDYIIKDKRGHEPCLNCAGRMKNILKL